MPTFTLITECNDPVAVLCDDPPSRAQLRTLYSILPESALEQTYLALRWEVALVLSQDAWASAQIKRRPMLKPKGSRLAFLAALVFLLAIGNGQSAIAQVPPLPPITHHASRITNHISAPTQGSGAAALITKVAAVVPAPSIKTNRVTLTWSYPVNVTTQTVFTAWNTTTQSRQTNTITWTNLVDLEGRPPLGPWSSLATTNRPPVTIQTTNPATLFRLNSYWK